ncbi:MAG TPA: hypothetical protein VK982_06820, partial [Bacteroidales bacterium]|nr:hypothetical protein [Bacteroidales bacterium]
MAVMEKVYKNLPSKYRAVASVLREGKERAILSQDIMKLADLKDKRQVHEIIEQLILKHGFVIGASRRGEHRGYYLISNYEEFKETADTYNEQIQS